MQNMKFSTDQQKETMPSAAEMPKQEYPYGLRITLDKAGLEKLGIKELPKPGTKFAIEAIAVVESAHMSTSKDSKAGDYKSVDLQITDLSLDSDAEDKGSAADTLYSKKA